MVLAETVHTNEPNNIGLRSISSHSKAPIYTSDKRAKFTQRTNKKWVRLATVFGYMISVSTPAVILSIYYICFWHHAYLTSIGHSRNSTDPTVVERQTRSADYEQYQREIVCQPCVCESPKIFEQKFYRRDISMTGDNSGDSPPTTTLLTEILKSDSNGINGGFNDMNGGQIGNSPLIVNSQ